MINRKLKLVTLFLATFFNCNLLIAQVLPEFHAKYAIEKYGIEVAEASYQLNHRKNGYKFTQHTELTGFASLFANDTVNAVSLIDEVNGKLFLQQHRYIQTGREKNKNEDFSIEWSNTEESIKGNITGVVRNKTISLETEGPVWEVLSFQIPLMIDANKKTKHYPYKAILKGEINTYDFVFTSSKNVAFADKEYELLQMVRTDPHKNRQLHIWIAPELHNLPVIIENYKNGKEDSRMQLKSVKFSNDKTLNDQLKDEDDEF